MSLPPELTTAVLRLLDAPDAQWPADLEQLCAAHPEQADELRAAAMEARAGQYNLEQRPVHVATGPLVDTLVGSTVGTFTILERLGEGGMGAVYLAEQKAPVRRRVALKVIKSGMDTRAVLARFDAERQALARMSHSNITKVFEAGATPDGKPYFAMEYVSGIPITQYCDRHTLPLDERLVLFRQVCSGVQHAHTKGVIHRDLTPNNILVTVQDGQATVKIIDFGLARATDHRLTEMTLFTAHGVLAGTPEYMSPEQAGLDGLDIDMRTDVYTLGVLLYELLIGKLPFESTELRKAGYDSICRTIREVDPPKPSTRLTTSAQGGDAAAHARRTDLRSLSRQLRGDLDWIVMKCLEKDRTRRYETVTQLSEDVHRHLRTEPVLARDPGAVYRFRKFARRHRGGLLAAASVLATVVVGFLVATQFWLEARARTREFDHLATVLQLEQARQVATELMPPWPRMLPAMEQWLSERAAPLSERLREARLALGELVARALPDDESQLEAARHNDREFTRLTTLRALQQSLRSAQAARLGTNHVLPKLTAAELLLPPDQLLALAWDSVAPTRTPGSEARGLAYAEHLATTGFDESADRPHSLATVLAQARLVNGLTSDAEPTEPGNPTLGDTEAALAELTATIDARRLRRFANDADQFLYGALRRLVDDLEVFVAVDYRRMRHRLTWAKGLVQVLRHPKWAEAIAAIRAADGVTAHDAYGQHPCDLQPMPGLVPIGMNPVTRLWEFYDLESARDPDREVDPTTIPVQRHPESGHIAVRDDAGIVLVLIPGAQTTIGAQRKDPKGLNYDPDAQATEQPPQQIGLTAYMIARHETTQAQWQRLTGGSNPSRYPPGYEPVAKLGQQITLTNPVENISWQTARAVMRSAGMDLPTEAQWEHACRAGHATPWWTGPNRETLRGVCNIADQTATDAGQFRAYSLEWRELRDGFIAHAPVDTLRANPFGLHHVHGNVAEWCRDGFGSYADAPCAPGDGLRRGRDANTQKSIRGGNFSRSVSETRSANRVSVAFDYVDHTIGVRPVRHLDQR